MDMKVNKIHSNTLIENSAEEPLLTQPVKLVSPHSGVFGINSHEETHGFTLPPLSRLTPPAENFNHLIETLPPDKGGHTGSFSLKWTFTGPPMSFDMTETPEKGKRNNIIVEHMFHCQGVFSRGLQEVYEVEVLAIRLNQRQWSNCTLGHT
jgi:hypothetical protein